MNHAATQHNYDKMSRYYNLFSGSEKRFTEAGLLLLNIKPTDRILEIGCGTGHALRRFSSAGRSVIGMDLSAGMLAQARRAGSKSGILSASLCQGDAIRFPFKANAFNIIFLSFTLELFSENEIPLVLAECRRALRWDGRLGVVALAKENSRTVRLYEWFHARWPRAIDCRPIHLHDNLIKAGYAIREAQRMVMWGLPVEIIVANRDL